VIRTFDPPVTKSTPTMPADVSGSGLSAEGGSFAGPVRFWPRAVIRCADD
jgi:hypothetical protein